MAAVCWNQKEAMEKLASKGADMDMKNLRGETAYGKVWSLQHDIVSWWCRYEVIRYFDDLYHVYACMHASAKIDHWLTVSLPPFTLPLSLSLSLSLSFLLFLLPLSPVIAEDPETRQYILDLRGQYGQSQEINLEEMEASGEICRRPRRMSVKRTRQQDKEGLAKQSAQAEAELRKKSLAAEVNFHHNPYHCVIRYSSHGLGTYTCSTNLGHFGPIDLHQ